MTRASAVALLWLGCVSLGASASAHQQRSSLPAPDDTIVIPTLTHGQMAVIADNRAAILRLAAQQMPTDRVMRRLQGFINLQYSACLWGLMPGSLTDEASPFNECSHAYLAATRSLLLHLRDMQGDRAPVVALTEKIELEMLRHDASLRLCRYSDETFNTANVIKPDWRTALSRLAPGLSFVVAPLLIGVGVCRWSRRWMTSARSVAAKRPQSD